MTPDRLDRLAALTHQSDPVVIEVRRVDVRKDGEPTDPVAVLIVTLDSRCEHWGDEDDVTMMWSEFQLWLDVWPAGEVTVRCLLTAHRDPVVALGPDTSPSVLVGGAVRSMREGTPGHWHCRADRLVPALLAVLAAVGGWDNDRVEAERVAAALALAI